MPSSQTRDGNYSSATGLIFLFNIIVGTGALALPGVLQRAGWVMGIFLLVVLALFSYITVTFVLEALAVSNAVSKRNYGGTGTYDENHESEVEETPLVPRSTNQEGYLFEITELFEIGQMGVLLSPKWSQVVIYVTLCVYMYGDLSIYAVVMGKSLSDVLCHQKPDSMGDTESFEEPFCWKEFNISRMNFYRLCVGAFVCLAGPFVFFDLQKTKFLQISTALMRWLAFFIMLVWSIQKLITVGKKGNPPVVDFKTLPTLFGTVVYSYMCQHSIPGVLEPIGNKKHLKVMLAVDFILVSIFYLTLSLTAIFTFQKIQDIYTLNFWQESFEPHASSLVKILSYYLALFPVFTISTSFPIVAITLRNNLKSMILRGRPSKWYHDKLLFPLLTIIPPTILALVISDIHLLVGIIGSYAGACVQYMIPCMLVFFARTHMKDFNAVNIYASPFVCKFWIYAVFIWMCISLILISIKYATN